MRRLTISLLMILVAVVVYGQDQTQPSAAPQDLTASQRAARDELNRAAAAYRAGNFAEAHQHSQKALSLDPTNRSAPIFVARTLHVQYKPGDDSTENVEIARAAITAYQKILSYDPLNEEAYKAVAVLYHAIREDQLRRDWILQRATNPLVLAEKRAEAYAVLAGINWDCSFKITELPESKLTKIKGNLLIIVYLKPKSELDFQKAGQCVTSGLEMADNALAFDPECETAWSYKTNLLIERSKLAEMEGQHDAKRTYLKAADEAQAQTSILAEKRRRREEGVDKPESQSDYRETQPPRTPIDGGKLDSSAVTQPSRAPIDGGELDNIAVKKPLPPYPPAARAAHVSGSVRVAVVVDESGRVVSAAPVDGHMLLQHAAVAAARQARFSPTYRDGQLVMIRGFLTYEFVDR